MSYKADCDDMFGSYEQRKSYLACNDLLTTSSSKDTTRSTTIKTTTRSTTIRSTSNTTTVCSLPGDLILNLTRTHLKHYKDKSKEISAIQKTDDPVNQIFAVGDVLTASCNVSGSKNIRCR